MVKIRYLMLLLSEGLYRIRFIVAKSLKDFYYYGCKHRNMTRGHKCDYKKQVHEEMLDASAGR